MRGDPTDPDLSHGFFPRFREKLMKKRIERFCGEKTTYIGAIIGFREKLMKKRIERE